MRWATESEERDTWAQSMHVKRVTVMTSDLNLRKMHVRHPSLSRSSPSRHQIIRRPQIKTRVLAELANLDINDSAQMSPSVLSERYDASLPPPQIPASFISFHIPFHSPSFPCCRLPFLDMCIRETLRLYPVAINLSRVAAKDTVLGGFKIPKGNPSLPPRHPRSPNPDNPSFRNY